MANLNSGHYPFTDSDFVAHELQIAEHTYTVNRVAVQANDLRYFHIGIYANAKSMLRDLQRRKRDSETMHFGYDVRIGFNNNVNFWSQYRVKTIDHGSWTEAIGVTTDVFQGKALMLPQDPAEDGRAIMAFLRRYGTIPFADTPEWQERMVSVFQMATKPWHSWQPNTPQTVRGVDLLPNTLERIEARLAIDLRSGKLSIPSGLPAPDLDVSTMDLNKYMLTFGTTLAARVSSDAVHQPGTAPNLGILRKPFMAQADAVAAIDKCWKENRKSVFLVGEQGVGKTLISLAAAYNYLDGRPGVIAVHAPAHLIKKWEREARMTLPGIKIRHIRTMRDAMALIRHRATSQELWVIPRDRAKLGYQLRPAYHTGRRFLECPDCGEPLGKYVSDPNTDNGKRFEPFWADDFESKTVQNSTCPKCHAGLWQMDGSKARRYPITKILKRAEIDILIADEVHEEKADTLQGQSLGRLISAADRVLMITATLLGGKSSDMYHHLMRTQGRAMREAGYTGERPFIESYGSYTHVAKRVRNKKGNLVIQRSWKESPGINPCLFPDWMLPNSVFIDLEDLKANLPEYDEDVRLVKMTDEQKREVSRLEQQIRAEAQAAEARGEKPNYSAFLHKALALPDIAGDAEELLPKEVAMVAECMKERMLGRRCAIYIQYTKRFDVAARLQKGLEDQGLTVDHLTTDIPPEDREEWLHARKGDVLITHSKLVATGLDLTQYPTIMWCQFGWSLFDLRQASRRSWRLGQDKRVRVLFYAYEKTMQESVLRVLASKMVAAQAIEGRFSAEGLQAMINSEDILHQMAQILVHGISALPQATDVWKFEQADMEMPVLEQPTIEIKEPETPTPEVSTPEVPTTNVEPLVPVSLPLVIERRVDFDQLLRERNAALQKQMTRAPRVRFNPGQLTLFTPEPANKGA
ncbi:MAG: DEAD/DEAH box helicase family protein [Sulfobacillus sp.]